MKISVFTPIHKFNEEYTKDLFSSLISQTNLADEVKLSWVVVFNGEMLKTENVVKFQKIVEELNVSPNAIEDILYSYAETTGNVSELKRVACLGANADVLVEVDWDDILRNDAIDSIYRAFSDDSVHFVYSNSAQFGEGMQPDGTWPGQYPYGSRYGWKNRVTTFREQLLWEMIAFPATAHSMRRIEWAPNHVRAWRKSSYVEIGGHDPKIVLGDDHDLVCRFYIRYGGKGFRHIDECLYYYRKHDSNTCATRNKEVQDQVHQNYLNYIHLLAQTWAWENDLRRIDFGGRFNAPEGYETVDLLDADIIMDLDEDWTQIADNSVGVLRAYHTLEHLKNPIHFFNEAFRVLAPGGFLLVEVPSTNGVGAWADPTHISFFNEHSFQYYTNEQYARYIRPQYNGRFQAAGIREWWWNQPKLPIVTAELIALKPGYEEFFSGDKLI